MDARTGTWQLRRLLVSYCKHSGSSRGAREFVEKHLPQLQQTFPHVEVEVKLRSGKHPHLEGYYLNGRNKPIGVKNLEAEAINEYAEFLANQWGGKHAVNQQGWRVRSTQQSVQGMWTPYTNLAASSAPKADDTA